MLGLTSLVIGVPALAFALFGWSQTAQPLFGIYTRYICIFGSLGAMIFGALLAHESLVMRKNLAGMYVAQSAEESPLVFQVVLEKEEEKLVNA